MTKWHRKWASTTNVLSCGRYLKSASVSCLPVLQYEILQHLRLYCQTTDINFPFTRTKTLNKVNKLTKFPTPVEYLIWRVQKRELTIHPCQPFSSPFAWPFTHTHTHTHTQDYYLSDYNNIWYDTRNIGLKNVRNSLSFICYRPSFCISECSAGEVSEVTDVTCVYINDVIFKVLCEWIVLSFHLSEWVEFNAPPDTIYVISEAERAFTYDDYQVHNQLRTADGTGVRSVGSACWLQPRAVC